jgi:putative redox protein
MLAPAACRLHATRMRTATVRTDAGKLRQSITIGPHHLVSDEPVDQGGDDAGPAPHDFLLAALGACTSMTLELYAARKGWALRGVEIELSQAKEDGVHVIQRRIRFDGDLDEEQRARLVEIANKCPVHRTLTGEIRINTQLSS